ncbi:MAG: hypothetical protein AYK18_16190 [Theionarchaea archaeon DG-70]|nr:MAG: hypothetical protein AM326_06150 [Candidatus Thorarchaeota archaeon SMTZ-45]KYK32156.1 MAG: hypothetical protein AYK18_16190 [Theionarchaea archaeon DG-70]
MRVGIDIRMYNYTGVGEYIKGLLEGLAQIDDRNEYVLLSQSEDLNESAVENGKFTRLKIDLRPFSLAEPIGLALALRKIKPDVFHCPHFIVPALFAGPLLVTLHDLVPLRFPNLLSIRSRSYYHCMLKVAVRKARKIIAVSNCTKGDIMDFLHVSEDKIVVIHEGVRGIFRPVRDVSVIERVLSAHGIEGKFIVYLGQWKPHKNVEGLIKAFHYAKARVQLPHKLVICGRKNSRYYSIPQLVRRLQIQNDVIFVGLISDHDLPILLSAADLLVYPSFYEGFGLPPLQAMACGTPVIASSASSIPEVIGDSGLLHNPHNIQELSDSIIEILVNTEIRRNMIAKGLKRAKMFSWKEAAWKTLKLYEEVNHER